MRPLCLRNVLYSVLLILIFSFGKYAYALQPRCVGVFLHANPPLEMFYAFDWAIVDPDGTDLSKVSRELASKKKARVFAYLSVGEVEPYREDFSKVRKEWILGENKYWKSYIVDVRRPEYEKLLMERVKRISEKGYDGLFLDTLDSYQMVLDKKEWKSYERAQAEIIKRIKSTYPHLMIITNRGFEIFEDVKGYIDGFLVEGLFSKLDFKTDTYVPVPEEERKWLLERLKPIKALNIPIIIVDYADLSNKKQVNELIGKISSLGFIPYISEKELNVIGVGPCRVKPRKVLLIFSSKDSIYADYSQANRLAALPFEYYGYVPVLWDIEKGLPGEILKDKYAGIVVWVGNKVKNYKEFHEWILKQIRDGVRVLFIDSFGFPIEDRFLSPLGIVSENNKANVLGKVEEVYRDKRMVGFEIEPKASYSSRLIKPKDGRPLLILRNEKGQEHVPLAITSFGGYALEGTSVVTLMGYTRWVVDPFAFFKEALNLEDIPAPDVTTENGRRILITHIDGDAFMERFEGNPNLFASEIIRDRIIKRFKIPHTVSIIEGEIAPWGLYPELSPKLEEIARSIFALDNVEAASHTFSHPLDWMKLYYSSKDEAIPSAPVKYSLPIQNYTFDLRREIEGSVKYINERLLAGTGKKVKVFLWSGYAVLPPEAIKLTYELGLFNMNGGNTDISESAPFLSRVYPMGIEKDGYFQVYAPIINENIYTNLWTHPYYGYINVIQTFKLTEDPRRLKPINIYYHMYSGSKIASLRTLEKVYEWVLSQKVNPMFVSDYTQRVLDFRKAIIVKDEEKYTIYAGSALRTLRIPASLGFPNIEKSKGVVGYNKKGSDVYVHLDGSGYYELFLNKEELPYFMLIDSNGQVEEYKKENGQIELKLKSYVPLEFSLLNPQGCSVQVISPKTPSMTRDKDVLLYTTEGYHATIKATCR